ncbi:MAG: hypothetical protein FWF22_08525, partial [Treponema sp.]|nr:hypothetical protein [Treponema sp.]
MGNMAASILEKFESVKFRAAFLPFHCMDEITKHYDEMANNADIGYIKNVDAHFRSNQPPDLPFTPLSFLIAAYPSDPARVIFKIHGENISVPIPPTYLDYFTDNKKLID